jgi:transposase
MSYERQTLLASLFPSTCQVILTKVTIVQNSVRLQLTASAPTACCPCCAGPSSAVHSRYQRHLTDLPWGALAVHIQLMVWTFICRNPGCTRRIFTERLPHLVAPSARKTHRLVTVLQSIAMALGGQAGAQLAARLQMSVSATTLLRLMRVASIRPMPAPKAVGIDEWAWRRGHRYGTILVDLASHRVMDLLPERSAATVAAWLAQHPTITVVCRDRSPLYADGIRQGDPDAVQVVDRFHLVDTLRDAVEACLRNQREALQAAAVRTAQALTPLGPSARAVSFTLICPVAKRSQDAQIYVEQLCQINAEVARANDLIQTFLVMGREHRGHDLEAWMAEATASGIDELARFARGLEDEVVAITAGLTLEWSNGVTEGQIHRLKLVKRQGYGRAGFALLRQRVLQTA